MNYNYIYICSVFGGFETAISVALMLNISDLQLNGLWTLFQGSNAHISATFCYSLHVIFDQWHISKMIRCSPLPPTRCTSLGEHLLKTQQYWEGSLARDQNPGSNGGERDVLKEKTQQITVGFVWLFWDKNKKTSKRLCCQIVTKNKCTGLPGFT